MQRIALLLGAVTLAMTAQADLLINGKPVSVTPAPTEAN